jgi:hypothetical protein
MLSLSKEFKWAGMGIIVGTLLFAGCGEAPTTKAKPLLPDNDKKLDASEVGVDKSSKSKPEIKPLLPVPSPNAVVADPKPDKAPVISKVEVEEPKMVMDLKRTKYVLSAADRQHIMSTIERLAPQEINTDKMESYYSTSGFSANGIPSSKKLRKDPPKTKKTYWRLYYQDGVVRVKTAIKKGKEKVVAKVFYNDKNAPILVAKPFGKWYNCNFLEYDEAGYLKRSSNVSFIRNFFDIKIYETRPGYKDVIAYEYSPKKDDLFILSNCYHYSPEGSFSWSAKTGKKKKYSSRSFLNNITVVEKYGLAPLLPIPKNR